MSYIHMYVCVASCSATSAPHLTSLRDPSPRHYRPAPRHYAPLAACYTPPRLATTPLRPAATRLRRALAAPPPAVGRPQHEIRQPAGESGGGRRAMLAMARPTMALLVPTVAPLTMARLTMALPTLALPTMAPPTYRGSTCCGRLPRRRATRGTPCWRADWRHHCASCRRQIDGGL